jgi:hypothetical protein
MQILGLKSSFKIAALATDCVVFVSIILPAYLCLEGHEAIALLLFYGKEQQILRGGIRQTGTAIQPSDGSLQRLDRERNFGNRLYKGLLEQHFRVI